MNEVINWLMLEWSKYCIRTKQTEETFLKGRKKLAEFPEVYLILGLYSLKEEILTGVFPATPLKNIPE